jgi:hypothetical protein
MPPLQTTQGCGTRPMVDFADVLSLDDKRWSDLTGGYGTRFDPRSLLEKLEAGNGLAAAWHDCWDQLHHQGDVGTASYAAVPHIVRIYRKNGLLDWNAYAIVAVVELARLKGANPGVPEWIEDEYFRAIQELAEIGATEILRAQTQEAVRAILGVLAIAKGLRTHGRFLIEFSEPELLEIESRE